MILTIIFIVVALGLFIRQSLLSQKINDLTVSLKDLGYVFDAKPFQDYDGVLRFSRSYSDETVSPTAFQRLQQQFALFLDAAGYEFVPEKRQETHQGMLHEVKVTPAKFTKAKAKSRK